MQHTPRYAGAVSKSLGRTVQVLFLYLVDAIGIEGQVVLNLGNSGVRSLISPHRIGGAHPSRRDAVVSAIALVRAVGGVVRPLQERHVDVLARDVLNRRVGGLSQGQSLASIGDDPARQRHGDPHRIRRDRNRVIRSGELYRFRLHGVEFSCCSCGNGVSPRAQTAALLHSRNDAIASELCEHSEEHLLGIHGVLESQASSLAGVRDDVII